MDRKLKVCHVSDFLPKIHSFWGGAEQACLRLIEASRRSGIDVSVITTKPDTQINHTDFLYFSNPTLDTYFGNRILNSLSLKHFGFDPVSFFYIKRILKKLKPDVVHVHRIVLLTASPVIAARSLGIPVIASIYDYFFFCPKETLVNRKGQLCSVNSKDNCVECMDITGIKGLVVMPFSKVRKKIFNYLFRDVDYHVLSSSSHNILSACGIDDRKIHKIPQIFTLKNKEGSSQTERGLILYIGWIQERKGLHILIEALPEILSRFPDAYLIAIGAINKDAYFDKIQKMISEKGLTEKVNLLGKLDYAEVSVYMDKANVVIIPEQWNNMSPVVLVEAMSMGKPVVASNIGGIPEFVDGGINGLLAEASSQHDFAQKISDILTNKDLAQSLGINARQCITKRLDERELMKSYRKLYEGVLNEIK
jgi:glycosyltransferase involved in cell wall biosynthesis